MGTVSVRVVPRSSRRGLTREAGGRITIRVHAPPEDGRATEEARAVLAEALGVAKGGVSLRTGARSRTKVFDVEGVSSQELQARLSGR